MPIHLEHLLERNGCMLVVFLGETVDDITDTATEHSLTFYWVCGLCFVFISATKILFFDADCEDINNHALRTDRLLGLTWTATNAWSWFSIALTGSAMNMILASINSPRIEQGSQAADNKTPDFDLDIARRLFCGGLASIVLCFTIAALCHQVRW